MNEYGISILNLELNTNKMDNEETYKVLIGDVFGGFAIVEDGLTLEAAEKLERSLQEDCDYFTTTMVKPTSDKTWG